MPGPGRSQFAIPRREVVAGTRRGHDTLQGGKQKRVRNDVEGGEEKTHGGPSPSSRFFP